MKKFVPATLIATLAVVIGSLSAAAEAPLGANAQRALQWLQCTQQQPDGQIGSGGNPIARSSEVALGLAAVGQPASALRNGAASLADYLTTAVSSDVGTNGELLLARASQPDAGPTATVAAALQASKTTSGTTAGEYGGDIYSDALAILGLRADGQAVGTDSIAFLKDHQKSDGGWSFDNADQFGTDSNTTAVVLQALLAAGVPSTDASIGNGFTYLQSVFSQGGFGDTPGMAPDPNSDELIIQAIRAAGQDKSSQWSSLLHQAMTYLAGQQIATGTDQGAITSSFSKLFATTFAPSAFMLRPLTETGLAEHQLALLSCPAAAASSSPSPSAAPSSSAPPTTTVLAPTGRPTPAGFSAPSALGLLFIVGGLTVLAVRRRRPRH